MAYMKDNKEYHNITIRNAEIMFRNFEGRRKEVNGRVVNEEGQRNFCVIIDDNEVAERLIEDGWNIRITKPREEGDEPRYYLSVSVNFNYRIVPEIHLRSGNNDTILNEDTVDILDVAEIKNVGLTIRPRVWDNNGAPRVKAYLKSMIVTLEEDELLAEYASEESPAEDSGLPF